MSLELLLDLTASRKDKMAELNRYYAEQGKPQVRSLDDLTANHVSRALGNMFGIRQYHIVRLKEKLTELDCFPLEL